MEYRDENTYDTQSCGKTPLGMKGKKYMQEDADKIKARLQKVKFP